MEVGKRKEGPQPLIIAVTGLDYKYSQKNIKNRLAERPGRRRGTTMNTRLRAFFDKQVDRVLKRLPPRVHQLLEEVPLYVEDYPSRKLMRQMNLKRRDDLCGVFVGRTIGHRFDDGSGSPGFIAVYREAVYQQALDEEGYVDTERLREEIKITILHELAHYHGIDEEELQALGYG